MSINAENGSRSMPGSLRDPQQNQGKPVVVGLYGVDGSGKTTLLNQLEKKLSSEKFAFYDGASVIAHVYDGSIEEFKKLEEDQKTHWRQCAIDHIRTECAKTGNVGLVAGHLMFWTEGKEAVEVYTPNDLHTFTHILYLDVPADVVSQRILDDNKANKRVYPSPSIPHLRRWQEAEKTQLRSLCRDHDILFSLVSSSTDLSLRDKVLRLLKDFQFHDEKDNLRRAQKTLSKIIAVNDVQLQTVLVLDADRTLASQDTGSLFWEVFASSEFRKDDRPLKTLFSSKLGYSYTAFRQATLLYEEVAEEQEFDALCQVVASRVTMYPEIVALLKQVGEHEHIGAVIVSCGLRRVWEKVLEREGVSDIVKVIAGGRIADDFVVTAEVKAALVSQLQDEHQIYVWAFGDSPLDLDMLGKADQAIVVVGEQHSRSKTMDAKLMDAIVNNGLHARQALLPSTASLRLDTTKLPLVQLTDQEFIDSVLYRRGFELVDATDKNATKLLKTAMRDAEKFGPVLREAHRRVGWYLAVNYLSEVIGVEEYSIPHVQDHLTTGHRLLYEKKTSVIALMRAGEPMAFGVSDAFPLAMFIHANRPEDIKFDHLQEQKTVILVDSVVNNGKTVVEFVQHVRKLHPNIRIVVVAGVVQKLTVSERTLEKALRKHKDITLVALRLSENKYTGTRTVDTGNRLFNTTHLP